MKTEVIPICRICLETLEEYIDMESSFYSDHTQGNSGELTYMDCFKQCTLFNVEINGHIPQGMCVPCSLDLRFAYEFLKKAENAAQFYEEYAKNLFDELQIMPKQCDPLECSPLTMNENDMIVEIEKVELDDPLSEMKEFSIAVTQSDEDTTNDILELNDLKSDEDNDHSDTDNTLKVREKDDEEINIAQQHEEKLDISSVRSNKIYIRTCKICQKKHNDLNLAAHMEKYHMHVVKCQHCEYECKEFKLRKHEKLKHPNTDKYLCDICSKTFLTLGPFNAHLKFHQRKQTNSQSDPCTICGKTFSVQSSLRTHLEEHKNERKMYECKQCDKLYYRKGSLDYHIKMHKGETFKCLECDKQFSRKNDLKIHMSFHTREFPFDCEVCGKKFAIKSHLRAHMWRHQGLKLQCEKCPKLFASSHALLKHSYTHLAPAEMPFQCCYCSKAYPSTNKYRVHLKSAHSIVLNEEELRKVRGSIVKKPLIRKKLKLVQADSVLKES